MCDKDLYILAVACEAPLQSISKNRHAIPHLFMGGMDILYWHSFAEYTVYGKEIHVLDAIVENALYNQVQ